MKKSRARPRRPAPRPLELSAGAPPGDVRLTKRGGLFKSPSRTLLLIVYSVAAPICASPLYFISPGTAYHNLMTMGFYAFYLFFILFYERLGDAPERFVKRKNWGILLLSAAMLFNFTLISNVAYHKLQLAFYSSYGEAIRMADRIEQTDGTSECDTLAVLGIMPGSEAYSAQVSLDLNRRDRRVAAAPGRLHGQSERDYIHAERLLPQEFQVCDCGRAARAGAKPRGAGDADVARERLGGRGGRLHRDTPERRKWTV